MARKNYSAEFRQQAVVLYESSEGATLKQVAAELGVSRGTLALWVKDLGRGLRSDGDVLAGGVTRAARGTPGQSPAARIARLEAENARLRADKARVETERDILRKAAKYFASATSW